MHVQVANRGLGVLTYVSQSRSGEGRSEGVVAQGPGPAAEASSYQVWTSQEFSHPVETESNTWPPVHRQGRDSVGERSTEQSSGGSAGMPGSARGDAGGSKDSDGGASAAPPRGDGTQ